MKVILDREEMLAIIILMESKKRLSCWEKSALDKLLRVMGLKAMDIWVKKDEVINE